MTPKHLTGGYRITSKGAPSPTLPRAASVMCPACHDHPSVLMRPGKAIVPTVSAGVGDFHDDDDVATFSADGPGRLVDCWKCPECGRSFVG